MDLATEADRLRAWAAKQEAKDGPWERTYPNWLVAHSAIEDFLSSDPDPTDAELDDLLFVLARDNDSNFVCELLADAQRAGLAAARRGLECDDYEARWQIATYLRGYVDDESRDILRKLAEDDHEYVRRNALIALKERDPAFAETLARAWLGSEHDYSRLAALTVLHDLESPHLVQAARMLRDDPFEHVRVRAREWSPESDPKSEAASG